MRGGQIVVPNAAPPWVSSLTSNVCDWVLARLRGPQALTAYVLTNRPDATKAPRSLIYDGTNDAPLFSDVSGNWKTLLYSGGAIANAQGAVISGTYLPTLTNVANLDASTAYTCQYMRVGNVVTVSGKVDVDPTALLSTKLGISFPIASTVSAAEKCAGTAVSNTVASEAASIEADTVNNRAQMEWIAVSVANHSMYFSFTYLIT